MSTLKRKLRDYGLKRRGNEVDVDQLRDIIRNEISCFGQTLGYRAVWHSLRLVHQIHVPRYLVATILPEVDPVGVQQRRRRRLWRRKYVSYGPNFCWTLASFSTLSGSFFSLFATDGLKYFERSSSFLDWNTAKVKSGFDAVCHSENSPYPYLSLSFCHIYGKRLKQSHIFRHKMSRTSLQKVTMQYAFFPRQTWMG